jgi:hypothetical protein
MWKTLVDFSAQISRFKHILPLSTAQINCSGTDLPLFRKPYANFMKSAAQRLGPTLPLSGRQGAEGGDAER